MLPVVGFGQSALCFPIVCDVTAIRCHFHLPIFTYLNTAAAI